MSNVVKITGSPAELIGAATLLSTDGERLQSDLGGLLGTIERLETDAVLGNDEFGREFKKTYHEGSPTATDATKDAALKIAEHGVQFGEAVGKTMQEYLVVDGQGAADISSVQST